MSGFLTRPQSPRHRPVRINEAIATVSPITVLNYHCATGDSEPGTLRRLSTSAEDLAAARTPSADAPRKTRLVSRDKHVSFHAPRKTRPCQREQLRQRLDARRKVPQASVNMLQTPYQLAILRDALRKAPWLRARLLLREFLLHF